MQNDIVRQPPVADPPVPSPQNTVSDVHIQPGTEAPQTQPAVTPEPATEATEQSMPTDAQPTTEIPVSAPEAPEEKPVEATEKPVQHKKAASGKPTSVIIGAVIACAALVGLAVYGQISSQDTAASNVPASQGAPNGTASGGDVSAEIDAALADIEAEAPANDMSAELSEITLGL